MIRIQDVTVTLYKDGRVPQPGSRRVQNGGIVSERQVISMALCDVKEGHLCSLLRNLHEQQTNVKVGEVWKLQIMHLHLTCSDVGWRTEQKTSGAGCRVLPPTIM